MNSLTPFFVCALAASPLAWLQQQAAADPPKMGTWSAQPTFVDEFDGDKLDSSKWNTGYRWQDVINQEMQGFVPENVSVEGGVCKIKVEKRPVQNTNWVGYKSNKTAYASGAIQSFDKFAQAYGYFEVRAKMPGGKGTWPAFWMLPDRGRAVKNIDERTWTGAFYKGTPIGRGVEIDIFEIMGSWTDPKTGAGKSHSGYFWGYDGKSAWGNYALDNNGAGPGHYVVPNQNTEFHTYGVAWGPGQLDFYVDGTKVLSREEPPSHSKIGTIAHYMILNVALKYDDWTPKKIPLEEIDADLPRTMVIDYVKVWSGLPSPTPAPIVAGTYRITPKTDAKGCLQIEGGNAEDGQKVVLASYTGASHQQWELSYLGGAVYEIKNVGTRKVMSLAEGKAADFTKVEQAADKDEEASRWQFKKVGDDGFFKLGPLLNVKSALSTYAPGQGTGAYVFYSSGADGQRFKFEPIAATQVAAKLAG